MNARAWWALIAVCGGLFFVLAAALSWPATRPKWLGLRSRQNLYGGAFGFGPAVAFDEVDEQGRHRSSWLVPTRTADAFAAALEHARDHARGPR
jgi:hypothetical protein